MKGKNAMRSKEVKKLAWSFDEVSQALGVTKGHLRNEVRRGRLSAIRSGRRTLILDEELHRYLSESNTNNVEKAAA